MIENDQYIKKISFLAMSKSTTRYKNLLLHQHYQIWLEDDDDPKTEPVQSTPKSYWLHLYRLRKLEKEREE